MRILAFRAIREKKVLAAVCFGILCVMIVAAFWPFNPRPTNHVAWLSDENGVRFDGRGIVLSPKGFEFADSRSPAGVSLELWLEPSQEKYSNALLSFSSPDNPEQFRLRQSHDFLLVLQEAFVSRRRDALRNIWVPHAFQAHKRRFIAISSGMRGTTVYLDGIPAEYSESFKLARKDFSGRLIVGVSPVALDTWRGKLFGLALFGRELTATQASEHYQAWLNGRPEVLRSDSPRPCIRSQSDPEISCTIKSHSSPTSPFP